MSNYQINIELVREVLKRATDKSRSGAFSQRGLSNKATNFQDRDAVGDIIRGRNKNPTFGLLDAIAKAMDKDMSIFGLGAPTFIVSEEQLRIEIEEALPHVPTQADYSEQAQYLAEAVANALGLPKAAPAEALEPMNFGGKIAEGQARASPKV
jgi:hypothetical protein